MDYSSYKAEDFAADESFIRYHQQSDPEDVVFWEHWILHHPEQIDEVAQAIRMLDMLTFTLPETAFEKEFQRMEAFLNQSPQAEMHMPEPDTHVIPFYSQWAVWLAVACVTGLIISVAIWQLRRKPDPSEWLTYQTSAGVHSTLSLSDGSRIVLNANTRILYPKKFARNVREVKLLQGEAFFEIAKNPKAPFVVHTPTLQTTVLGTKFNLDLDKNPSISLLEGSIKVATAGNESVILIPGQQAIYTSQSQRLQIGSFDAEKVAGWKDRVLVFDNASFDEISDQVLEMYGVYLVNKSQKIQWNYTGRFVKSDYLSVIRSIAFASHLSYTIRQDTVILTNQ